jgi:quercetin 2,3-dioxygenase
MITIRKSQDRGHAQHGWLDSYHTFSFADYFDERFMGFHALRVINDDRVWPSKGFGEHPHKDMEILTYVIDGQLQHKDSMGHEAVIKSGDAQKISAGTGIVHSEFNASKQNPVHFLQIWIVPSQKGIPPSYQQMSLTALNAEGLNLFASPDGGKGTIKIEQDVYIYRGFLLPASRAQQVINPNRAVWIQMVHGETLVNDQLVKAGDGVALEHEVLVTFEPRENVEFLLFDLK